MRADGRHNGHRSGALNSPLDFSYILSLICSSVTWTPMLQRQRAETRIYYIILYSPKWSLRTCTCPHALTCSSSPPKEPSASSLDQMPRLLKGPAEMPMPSLCLLHPRGQNQIHRPHGSQSIRVVLPSQTTKRKIPFAGTPLTPSTVCDTQQVMAALN